MTKLYFARPKQTRFADKDLLMSGPKQTLLSDTQFLADTSNPVFFPMNFIPLTILNKFSCLITTTMSSRVKRLVSLAKQTQNEEDSESSGTDNAFLDPFHDSDDSRDTLYSPWSNETDSDSDFNPGYFEYTPIKKSNKYSDISDEDEPGTLLEDNINNDIGI